MIAVIPHCFGMAWVHSLDGSIKVVLTDFACGKTFQKFYLSGFTLLYRWIVPSVCLVFTNFKVYRKVTSLSMFPINLRLYWTVSIVKLFTKFFMFRNFYCSNLSVLFIVRKFNLTLLEVELLLNIKDTDKYDQ